MQTGLFQPAAPVHRNTRLPASARRETGCNGPAPAAPPMAAGLRPMARVKPPILRRRQGISAPTLTRRSRALAQEFTRLARMQLLRATWTPITWRRDRESGAGGRRDPVRAGR